MRFIRYTKKGIKDQRVELIERLKRRYEFLSEPKKNIYYECLSLGELHEENEITRKRIMEGE